MTAAIIWGTTASLYMVFCFWYVGFGRKITSAEVEASIKLLEERSNYTE